MIIIELSRIWAQKESSRGVVSNVVDCDIVVSEFQLLFR